MPATRLAVDLSGGPLRVLEGLPGGPMRCGESGAPNGAIEKGRIVDPPALGRALRQLLARTEIAASRALIAASDNIASFRVHNFASDASDADIEAVLRKQVPTQSERMALRHTEVATGLDARTFYAAVWDRAQVAAISETARYAGLDPAVVELKSLCVARAVPAPSCVLLDMSSEPFEVVLIENHVPRIWHSFSVSSNGDLVAALAAGLKPVLGFHRPSAGSGFGSDSPILVRSEQLLPTQMAARLKTLTGHPVEELPQPPRIDPEIRFGPFLVCIGMVMRRRV